MPPESRLEHSLHSSYWGPRSLGDAAERGTALPSQGQSSRGDRLLTRSAEQCAKHCDKPGCWSSQQNVSRPGSLFKTLDGPTCPPVISQHSSSQNVAPAPVGVPQTRSGGRPGQTIFTMIWGYCLSFSPCWHWHWWFKSHRDELVGAWAQIKAGAPTVLGAERTLSRKATSFT